MEKNNDEDQPILKDAAQLWRALTVSAELTKVFYDKELLYGNETNAGIYGHLGMSPGSGDFAADLEKEKITVEKLLIAFFRTLQPYAGMMSDLCAFFERHGVRETNNHIRVQFDFDSEGLKKLDFDLNHFREHLARYDKAKELVSYFFLSNNTIWELLAVFSSSCPPERSQAPWIIQWRENYGKGIWNPIQPPVTRFPNLNRQLERIFNIWKSFGDATLDIGMTCENAYSAQFREMKEEEERMGWNITTLMGGSSDFWPSSFLELLFYRLEHIEGVPSELREMEAEFFAEAIQLFLEKHKQSAQNESNLIQELQDLLKLPIWNKRYELYNVWILAQMDVVLVKYPGYILHHDNGLLHFAFKATKLVSFDTAEGRIELWSELRMPLENPEGKSRTGNIQPDYTYVKQGEMPIAENGIVVVEVKQYQKPSKANFAAALNDYSLGVCNAHVFLVNYGAVASVMSLKRPECCTALGQIRPATRETSAFQDKLQEQLPEIIVPLLDLDKIVKLSNYDWMLLYLGYEYIYVDISASLNLDIYKEILNKVLKWSIKGGAVKHLIAIDERIRQIWTFPTETDVDELLKLPFNAGTDFGELIERNGGVLIITDKDGLSIARKIYRQPACHVICYEENKSLCYITD